MNSEEVLKKYFDNISFRDKQEEAVNSLLNNTNTLCLMPTGVGKSLIYQVTSLVQGKMALVISPLIALMEQQSEGLNLKIGPYDKSASAFNSNSGNVSEQYKYLRDDFNPPHNPQFLYVSPEKMMTDGYAEYVFRKYKSKIGLIVIDEAHCVSQWGHGFRPSYKMIPKFLRDIFGLNIPPILCLTATINKKDKEEIIRDFRIENTIVSDSLYRENIELHIEDEVQKNDDKRIKLEEIFGRFKGEKIIVYTHIKKRDYGTRAMSEYYANKDFNCAPFDGDMPANEKDRILKDFTNGDIKIIFATNAFGMGIDIPDIRCVVHYLVPGSIEQYYQEVGRAGRNGDQAFAYLLHAEPNLRIRKDLIKKSTITGEQIENFWNVLLGSKKDIPHIGQLGSTDVSDDNTEMIIFLKLVETGYVNIITKGIQDVNCFAEKKQSTNLSYYQSIVKRGYMKLISMKTGENLDNIHQNIFELYDSDKIKLIKTPTKLLYYLVIKELDKKGLDDIVNDFEILKLSRLESLHSLYEVLNKDLDIDSALKKQFDVLKDA